MAGRKKDDIWMYFEEKSLKKEGKKGSRAVCKKCNLELQGIVDRLKKHYAKCIVNTASTSRNIDTDVLNDSSETDTLTELMDVSIPCASPSTNRSSITTITSPPSPSPSNISTPVTRNLSHTSSSSLIVSEKSSKRPKLATLSNFVIKTSKATKHEIDKQIARSMFATNTSFRCIEHPQVKKAIEMLRPGYTPPSRFAIGTNLLDEIYNEEREKCFSELADNCVCLSIDGWSNVHNEPIICATIISETGIVYLLETIDTSGNPHTGEYMTTIVKQLINTCKQQYKCTVTSVVTDNAANMGNMRNAIRECTEFTNAPIIITYGCSAHILNLLSKDLEIKNIKEHVVHVIKYFRNNHFANAKYKQTGGRALVMPQEVRWNTLADCINVYVTEWQKLFQICEENRNVIDKTVYEKVANVGLKRSAEEFLLILKPIAEALDTLQKDFSPLPDAVEAWKQLEISFKDIDLNLKQFSFFYKRYEQAITPAHFLAYIVDPKKNITNLNAQEKESALEFAQQNFADTGFLPLLIKYQAKSVPFTSVMFSKEILNNVSSIEWWVSQKDELGPNKDIILKILKLLLCATSSSASVERVFSSFGLVHSKLRNRLGTEKAGKLVFLFKHFNNTVPLNE